jgi:hypothetical protein
MNVSSSARPLPLKQRTSSADPRRDASLRTWASVLGLLKFREYLVTVDHFSIWRRHMAWAISDGKELRDHICQRYASSMVFMSLLLSAELGVLFNSAGVTTEMRHALMQTDHTLMSFWAGIVIIISAILTLLSLISTFTAWAIASAVHPCNAHCIFRSSIGQYAAELPGRFIVCSIYSFLVWLSLFFFILLPLGFYSLLLLLIVMGLFIHTITTFSAFGRIIMHTGAMGSQRIFDPEYESNLLPHSLHTNLLIKARNNLANCTSIMRQYRTPMMPLNGLNLSDRLGSTGSNCSQYTSSSRSVEIDTPLSHPLLLNSPAFNPSGSDKQLPKPARTRRRTESLVKFADGLDTNGDPWAESTTAVTPIPPAVRREHSGKEQQLSSGRRCIRNPVSPLSVEVAIASPRRSAAMLLPPQLPRPPAPDASPRHHLFGGIGVAPGVSFQSERAGRGEPPEHEFHRFAPGPETTAGTHGDDGDNQDLYDRWLTTSPSGISSSSTEFDSDTRNEMHEKRQADGGEIRPIDDQCPAIQGGPNQSVPSPGSSLWVNENRDGTRRLLTEEEKFDLEYGEFPDRTVDDSLVCEYSDNEEDEVEEAANGPRLSGNPRESSTTERQALLGRVSRRGRGCYDSVPSRKTPPS